MSKQMHSNEHVKVPYSINSFIQIKFINIQEIQINKLIHFQHFQVTEIIAELRIWHLNKKNESETFVDISTEISAEIRA